MVLPAQLTWSALGLRLDPRSGIIDAGVVVQVSLRKLGVPFPVHMSCAPPGLGTVTVGGDAVG